MSAASCCVSLKAWTWQAPPVPSPPGGRADDSGSPEKAHAPGEQTSGQGRQPGLCRAGGQWGPGDDSVLFEVNRKLKAGEMRSGLKAM